MWTIEKLRNRERLSSIISLVLLVLIQFLNYPLYRLFSHFWGKPNNYYFAIFLVIIISTLIWAIIIFFIVSPFADTAQELDVEPSFIIDILQKISWAVVIPFALLLLLAGALLGSLAKSSLTLGGGFFEKLTYLLAIIITIFFLYKGIELLWHGEFLDALESLP